MRPLGLHHVAMALQDIEVYEKTIAFYTEVLELPVVRRWAVPPKHITMLDMGNSILELVFGAEGRGCGVFPHIAFAVGKPEDVDAMLAHCEAAGCKIVRPASDLDSVEEIADESGIHFGAPVRIRNGFCLGMAGEQIEFFCER